MAAKQYRKKPVVIEAMRLEWPTWQEMCEFVGVGPNKDQPRGVYIDANGNFSEVPTREMRLGLLIPTLEGEMLAVEGDWIIRGVAGEFYPCKPEIFDATYEPA